MSMPLHIMMDRIGKLIQCIQRIAAGCLCSSRFTLGNSLQRTRKSRPPSKTSYSAAEQVDQLNQQNRHHHSFENERARLVEFIRHSLVEVAGGAQLTLHQIAIVRH